MVRCTSLRWAMVCALAIAPVAFPPAAMATTGGPEIAEPLGFDPATRAAYFLERHYNESDERPTVLRLAPGKGPRVARAETWSIGSDNDRTYATYVARLRALRRRLRPLEERICGTIPGW